MRSALAIATCSALALTAPSAHAQQRIPVVSLSPASAKTTEKLGAVLGVRQLPGSKLLVDDAGHRQIKLFDSTLKASTVVIDSTPGVMNSYGPRAAPLIPYLGDSSLFADISSQTILVLDQHGQVARTMALPNATDIFSLTSGTSGVDDKGRLLYRGGNFRINRGPATPGAAPAPMAPPDSAPILRADLDARRVDTIGRVNSPSAGKLNMERTDDGKMKLKTTINPLVTVDDWAVLSDGSIAFVRGHDYHIDWIRPDGTTGSTAKLPFDWKRLTDDDKQKLIDSARKTNDSLAAKSAADAKSGANKTDISGELAAMGAARAAMGGGGGGGGADGGTRMMVVTTGGGGGGGGTSVTTIGADGAPGGRGGSVPIQQETEYAALKDIADYYPAIRPGASKADLDGNLWILPTTSAQSQNGELVYDVINTKGELFQRVRIPAGRAIAGFGKGGIVYLTSGDKANGFYLERTMLIGGAKAVPQVP